MTIAFSQHSCHDFDGISSIAILNAIWMNRHFIWIEWLRQSDECSSFMSVLLMNFKNPQEVENPFLSISILFNMDSRASATFLQGDTKIFFASVEFQKLLCCNVTFHSGSVAFCPTFLALLHCNRFNWPPSFAFVYEWKKA